MTALAMIIGMVPMALGLGEGGEQNAPLGRAVIGGLLLATFGTLTFVPAFFSLMHERTSRRNGASETMNHEQRHSAAAKAPKPPAIHRGSLLALVIVVVGGCRHSRASPGSFIVSAREANWATTPRPTLHRPSRSSVPKFAGNAREIVLPGNMQAFTQAPSMRAPRAM